MANTTIGCSFEGDHGMTYHVIIAQERRASTPENPRQLAINVQDQLHSMGELLSGKNPNILYAAEWDGVSPYVIVLKGDIADLKMAYAGWPMVDKTTWDAENSAKATVARMGLNQEVPVV